MKHWVKTPRFHRFWRTNGHPAFPQALDTEFPGFLLEDHPFAPRSARSLGFCRKHGGKTYLKRLNHGRYAGRWEYFKTWSATKFRVSESCGSSTMFDVIFSMHDESNLEHASKSTDNYNHYVAWGVERFWKMLGVGQFFREVSTLSLWVGLGITWIWFSICRVEATKRVIEDLLCRFFGRWIWLDMTNPNQPRACGC